MNRTLAFLALFLVFIPAAEARRCQLDILDGNFQQQTYANAVNSDASVVVGGYGSLGLEGYVWSEGVGFTLVPDAGPLSAVSLAGDVAVGLYGLWTFLEGFTEVSLGLGEIETLPADMDESGRFFVVRGLFPTAEGRDYYWDRLTGSASEIIAPPSFSTASPRLISGDASKVFGTASGPSSIFQWTSAGGFEVLETLASSHSLRDVDRNGDTLCGSALLTSGSGEQYERPFVWSQSDGLEYPDIPTSFDSGVFTGLSADGSTLCGVLYLRSVSGETQSVRWSRGLGFEMLNDPSGRDMHVYGISADGDSLVGSVDDGFNAFGFGYGGFAPNTVLRRLGDSFRWTTEGEFDGYCEWADGLTAPNIDIRAFSVRLSGELIVRESAAGEPTRSADNGSFVIPEEFFETFESWEIRRGLRCEYSFSYPSGTEPRTIVTYCGGDGSPLGASVDIRDAPSEEVLRQRIESIGLNFQLSLPVVFQPGWTGGLAHGGGLRSYFGTDYDRLNSELRESTRLEGMHVPAMPVFTVPDNNDGDGLAYGYDNRMEIATTEMLSLNGVNLARFPVDIMRPALSSYVPSEEELSFNLISHSYGGLISRSAMTLDADTFQPVCYAALDSIEGGLAWQIEPTRYVTQNVLNGFNTAAGVPPFDWSRGWNYMHRMDANPRRLSYSAGDHFVVQPRTAPYGVGRTALVAERLFGVFSPMHVFSYGLSNGHCHRFAGGHEKEIGNLTHSVHELGFVQREVGELFAFDVIPTGSSYAEAGTGNYEGCDVVSFFGLPSVESISDVELSLESASGGTDSFILESPEVTEIAVRGYVRGEGSHLRVLQGQNVLVQSNDRMSELSPGHRLVDFSVSVVRRGAPVEIRLVAGSGASNAEVTLDFVGAPSLASGVEGNPIYAGASAPMRAALQGEQSEILLTSTANVTALITRPDGATYQLQLYDDGQHVDGSAGDGVFGTQLGLFHDAGTYSYRVSLDAEILGYGSVVRERSGSFDVLSQDFVIDSFTGMQGIDGNSNGLFEFYLAQFGMFASRAGEVRIAAQLEHLASGDVTNLYRVGEAMSPGGHPIALKIPGEFIARHGGGDFALRQITLTDTSTGMSRFSFPDVALSGIPLSAVEPIAAPTIRRLLNDRGATSGGNEVFLQGTELFEVTRVVVDGVDAQFERGTSGGLSFIAPARAALPASIDEVSVDVRVITPYGEAILPDGYTYLRSNTTTPGGNTNDDGGGGGGCSAAPPSGPVSWRDVLGGGGWLAALALIVFVRARRSRAVVVRAA